MPEFRILIAASGTGGHLFPAVHIAKALKRQDSRVTVEFVGSGRPLEEKIIDAQGFRRHVISLVGLKSRGLGGFVEFVLKLPRAVFKTWRILTAFNPDVVVGVGGYVSFFPVTLAWLRGIPTWIHEAELKPGMANLFLCWYARKISTAFAEAKLPRMKNALYTGHPVRDDLRNLHLRTPREGKPQHLLIMGGSQGALALDKACCALADDFAAAKLSIVHQCRPENSGMVEAAYREKGVAARVVTFIENMAEMYTWADFALCRAGAGTVMEIEAVNLPAIFVPYPYAQANHQAKNAETLARKGKAIVVAEGENFETRLRTAIENLRDPVTYRSMFLLPADTRSLKAADEIAAGCLKLAAERK